MSAVTKTRAVFMKALILSHFRRGSMMPRGSSMSALQRIREEARKRPRKIALPEADETRTLQAAAIAAKAGVARVSLVSDDPGKVRTVAKSMGVDLGGVDLVEVPASGPGHEGAKRLYLERMRSKGLSESEAADHVRAP